MAIQSEAISSNSRVVMPACVAATSARRSCIVNLAIAALSPARMAAKGSVVFHSECCGASSPTRWNANCSCGYERVFDPHRPVLIERRNAFLFPKVVSAATIERRPHEGRGWPLSADPSFQEGKRVGGRFGRSEPSCRRHKVGPFHPRRVRGSSRCEDVTPGAVHGFAVPPVPRVLRTRHVAGRREGRACQVTAGPTALSSRLPLACGVPATKIIPRPKMSSNVLQTASTSVAKRGPNCLGVISP